MYRCNADSLSSDSIQHDILNEDQINVLRRMIRTHQRHILEVSGKTLGKEILLHQQWLPNIPFSGQAIITPAAVRDAVYSSMRISYWFLCVLYLNPWGPTHLCKEFKSRKSLAWSSSWDTQEWTRQVWTVCIQSSPKKCLLISSRLCPHNLFCLL